MSDFGSSTPPDPYQPGSSQPPPPPPPPFGQAPYGQGPGGGAIGGKPPPNYLVWAILSTVLCCVPLGIVSIVFAAQVNGKYAAGDLAGAKNSSDKARLFAILAASIGLVLNVIFIIAASAG